MTHSHHHQPKGAGKSSFELIDTDRFFSTLDLQPDMTFLDVACGRGPYSLAASERLGKAGMVHAFDLWADGIDHLKKTVADRGIKNIHAAVADAAQRIPVGDRSVDVALLATVLHDFVAENIDESVLNEVVRVLKPEGSLFIMEFKAVDGPPGPPRRIRLTAEACAETLAPFGFVAVHTCDVGPHNYLMHFKRR